MPSTNAPKRSSKSQNAAPAPTSTQAPVSLDLAQSIGGDTASEFIRGEAVDVKSPEECRAKNLARFGNDIAWQSDFLPVLHAWEAGFDEVMRTVGGAPSATTPAQTIGDDSKQSPDSSADGQKLGPAMAVHQPFSWLVEELRYDYTAQFSARVMDVCRGMQTALELVHSSDLDHEHNALCSDAPDEQVRPTLSVVDTGRMMLFVMASAGLLAEDAGKHVEWLNNHQERKSRAAAQGGAK